jgi:hypothetical protein
MIEVISPYIGLTLLALFGGSLCYLVYRQEKDSSSLTRRKQKKIRKESL